MATGTCTTHSWNDGAKDDEGEPEMGRRVDEQLKTDRRFYDTPGARRAPTSQYRARLRSQRVAAAGGNDDDDDDAW